MKEQLTLKNGRTVWLKSAEESDAAALAAHFRQAGGETDFLSFGADDCPYTEESCRLFIRESLTDGAEAVLVAYADGVLIGEARLIAAARKRFCHTAELAISVLREYHAQGLGTVLLRELLRYAKAHGCDSVHLTVDADNAVALALYRRFGFSEYGRYARASYYGGEYHDTIYMCRYFSREEELQ